MPVRPIARDITQRDEKIEHDSERATFNSHRRGVNGTRPEFGTWKMVDVSVIEPVEAS